MSSVASLDNVLSVDDDASDSASSVTDLEVELASDHDSNVNEEMKLVWEQAQTFVLFKDVIKAYESLQLRHDNVGVDSDQIFLIHGDSFLHEILNSPSLQLTEGLTTLHFFRLVEYHLSKLKEGKKQFRFIFFHHSSQAWSQTEPTKTGMSQSQCTATDTESDRVLLSVIGNYRFQDVLFLRELLIFHLKHHCHVLVDQFIHHTHETFETFLQRVDPAFVLVGDGFSVEEKKTDESLMSSWSAAAGTFPLFRKDKLYELEVLAQNNSNARFSIFTPRADIRSFTLHILSRTPIRCIRLTELKYSQNTLFGFQLAISNSLRRYGRIQGERANRPLDVADEPIYRVKCAANLNSQLLAQIESLVQEYLDVVHPSHPALNKHKFVVVLYSLHHVFRTVDSDNDNHTDQILQAQLSQTNLCKVFFIHSLFSAIVPLTARALSLVSKEDDHVTAAHPRVGSFIAQVYRQALPAVVNYTNSNEKQLPSLLDFFDGRLFAFLLRSFTSASCRNKITSLGITQEQERFVSAAWNLVDHESSFVPLFSIDRLSADDAKLFSLDEVKSAKEKSLLPLVQVDNHNFPEVEQSTTSQSPLTTCLVKPGAQAEKQIAKKPTALNALASRNDKDEDESGKKKAEEEELESWKDIGDEAIDDSEEKKEALGVSAAAADADTACTHPGTRQASTVRHAVALPIESIRPTKHELSDIFTGNLDQKLSAIGLVSSRLLSNSSSSAIGTLLDDGLDEKSVKTDIHKSNFRAKDKDIHHAKYITYLNKYAQSLAPGRLNLKEVLVTHTEDKKEEKQERGRNNRGGANRLNRIEMIRHEVAEKKKAEAKGKIADKLKFIEKQYKTTESKYKAADTYLESMNDALAIPALIVLLGYAVDLWCEGRRDKEYDRAARVWMHVHDIYRRFRNHLTSSTNPEAKADARQLQVLLESLMLLGFDSAAEMLAQDYVNFQRQISGHTLLLENVLPPRPSFCLPVGVSHTRFQLKYCGPYMLRNVDSAPDARVEGFYPDKWQRDVLDVIDSKQSALIVASTGAGKTFSSYYVIKNVLLENEKISNKNQHGIVVFISPTKALANQIVADVHKRYGDVHGVLLEEYSYRPLDCQVLVTTAVLFETLLLSPKREELSRRIRWVLADECHTIAATNDGPLLERCLAISRAPFLALSATVGNPQAFHQWLQQLEGHHGRQVHLITHYTRWSDLEKSIYLPTDPANADADQTPVINIQLLKHGKRAHSLYTIHPTVTIADEQELIEAKSFPQELEFTPCDSLSLYDAMKDIATSSSSSSISSPALSAALHAELKNLDPDVYFSTHLAISKCQAMKYEEHLKQALTNWVQQGHISQVSTVMRSLSSTLVNRIQHCAQLARQSHVNEIDKSYIEAHFFNLLLDLFATDRAPALIFCEDTAFGRKLVEQTVDKLESMQREMEKAEEANLPPHSKQILKDQEKEREAREKRRNAEEKKSSRDKDKDHDSLDPYEDEEDEPELKKSEVDQRFSFLSDTEQCSQSDIDFWVNRMLRKTQWKKSHQLVRCLRRGIAIHSPALPKHYNDLVEVLFRNKHLKFVLATRQLALGINMPAKCTVFLGDSKFLTPLLYRQMSGRAGRRGYDNVGHCVFIGVPPKKIWRLLKSPLTDLQGHYPLSTSLTLRIVSFYTSVSQSNPKACRGVIEALTPLIQTPLFAHTYPGKQIIQQLQYHFRYTIEHLHSLNLLDAQGRHCGLSALAMRIHRHNPANFAFIQLLNSGYIDLLCRGFNQADATAKTVSSQLLTCLAYLFNRVIMPAHATRQKLLGSVGTAPANLANANLILLPEMPPEMDTQLKKFNQLSLKITTTFLRSFSATQLDRADGNNDPSNQAYTQLPFSHLSFPAVFEQSFNAHGSTMLASIAKASQQDIYARDPFTALSNPVDKFTDLADVAESTRNGIYVEVGSLPFLDEVDWHGHTLQFNAYVVDFYRTGSLDALTKQNHLSELFAWGKLKQWKILLRDISSALATLRQTCPSLKGCSLNTVGTFKYLSTNFDNMLKKIKY